MALVLWTCARVRQESILAPSEVTCPDCFQTLFCRGSILRERQLITALQKEEKDHNDSPVTGIAGSNKLKELRASKVHLKRYRVALLDFNTRVCI